MIREMALQSLNLTPHQREVCVVIAQGHDQDTITWRLRVSRGTLKDEMRQIYNRLDIHCRQELMALLTTGSPPADSHSPDRTRGNTALAQAAPANWLPCSHNAG